MTSIATEPKPRNETSIIPLLYAARGLRGFGDGFAMPEAALTGDCRLLRSFAEN